MDSGRVRVFPVSELRGIFRDTSLELPQGLPPSLALELAELVGADAALWGSVEGRADASSELLVTIRLSLTGDHRLAFADTVAVKLGSADRTEIAIRRAVLLAARPMLDLLGDPGSRKRCFDAERTRALHKAALAAGSLQPSAAARIAPAVSAPPPPPRAEQRPEPKTPRQVEWAKRLADGGRIHVEDLAFAGRSADLQRDGGLADLAVALSAQPAVGVRVEGFVDSTSDRAGDVKLSSAMAQAVEKRLLDLGVPRQRLSSTGRGGESPILPNFTARGRAANRRIEVVVIH
jgi:outer membrane protein OmpA-like peptidoglycan-associated protein